MRFSVIVPTYKRPAELINCLSSLEHQTRIPDEVIVVEQDTDIDTQHKLEYFIRKSGLNIKKGIVKKPGVISALNSGLNIATGDIVCFIDDDAEASSDWIERIESYYSDKKIGGVGGRIVAYENDVPLIVWEVNKIGQLQWFGRLIGNYCNEVKSICMVDFLPGTNMSFRKSLITSFDENLKGDDYNFEVDMGLSVREKGYNLIFDPKIKVKHNGIRGTQKDSINWLLRSFTNAHNTVYVMLKHLHFIRKIIFLIYFFVVGDTASPGFIKILFLIGRKHFFRSLLIFFYATQGKLAGILTYEKCHPKFHIKTN